MNEKQLDEKIDKEIAEINDRPVHSPAKKQEKLTGGTVMSWQTMEGLRRYSIFFSKGDRHRAECYLCDYEIEANKSWIVYEDLLKHLKEKHETQMSARVKAAAIRWLNR